MIGIDNINDYYSPDLKFARLSELGIARVDAELDEISCLSEVYPNFIFYRIDVSNTKALSRVFKKHPIDKVCHLAAQAGVRYSIENPSVYIQSNLVGFGNILEAVRHAGIDHLIYASSSSVYGESKEVPFSTDQQVDHPISLYAATKKSNELMAHTYSHLYNIPTTGLRFFTVYGPYGRPDMAYYKFTKAILSGETIDLYNNGNMKRDFTYIDDIVEGIVRVMNKTPTPHENKYSTVKSPYRIYNIGNNNPVTLRDFISAIEEACEMKANENLLPMQPGDVHVTYAQIDELINDVGFKPSTNIALGLSKFVDWYKKVGKNLNAKT